MPSDQTRMSGRSDAILIKLSNEAICMLRIYRIEQCNNSECFSVQLKMQLNVCFVPLGLAYCFGILDIDVQCPSLIIGIPTERLLFACFDKFVHHKMPPQNSYLISQSKSSPLTRDPLELPILVTVP